MANDREKRDQHEKDRDELKKSDLSGKREIGEGMHSLDSTQVPLKAETGEPDGDAVSGRVNPDRKDENR